MPDSRTEPNDLNERIRASCERVMGAYALLGYPERLLGQWALPERDAMALIAGVEECSPRKILEVGTYVGVTTQLIALHTSPEAHVHTVDPNFPLHVEMSATRSNLYDSDTRVRTQDLGRMAADSLGVHDKISFHQGGFSVGSTFASNNTDPLARVEIIGPEICDRHGPFDFIFVDGLHYADAVFSDLMLASRYLADGGLLAMHDVKGRWGSNIRRAVFRFLAERDDFVFYHSPFTQLHVAIGFLRRRDAVPSRFWAPGRQPDTRGILQESVLPNLCSTIVEMFAPRSVLEVTAGNLDLRPFLLEKGVADVCTVQLGDHLDADDANQEPNRVQVLKNAAGGKKYDLCVCLGVADRLDPETASRLVGACASASDRVVFGATPPGELGEYLPNLRPISYWAAKFLEHGFVPNDAIRPRLEPLTYIDRIFPDYQMTSSYLLNTYVMERQSVSAGRGLWDSSESLIARESRIEDLSLQHFYQTLVIDDARRQIQSLSENLDQVRGEALESRSRLSSAQQELANAHQQLEKSRQQLEKSQRDFDGTRNELEGELEGVRQELRTAQRQLEFARQESIRIARERARELEKTLPRRFRRAIRKVARLVRAKKPGASR